MRHTIKRPVEIGVIHWAGLRAFYAKEVWRFLKIGIQTLLAPMVTSVLFLMVFAVAIGDRAQITDAAGQPVAFTTFLIPGLVMMAVLQNAFANTSSSLVVGKVQGNIVDMLMPPLGPMELLIGMAGAGMTRGLAVGLVSAFALGLIGSIGWPHHLGIALLFLILGALAMALIGIIAGVWASKFDSLAAVTNFLIQPLAFLSGTFYSIHRLPAPFDWLASINPIFMVIDGFRFGMVGLADQAVAKGLMVLLLVNLILFGICYRILKTGYRLKS